MTVLPLGRLATLVTEKAALQDWRLGLEAIESGTGHMVADPRNDYEGVGIAFEPGDVLFGKLRPYLAKAWLADRRGAAVGDFHVFRPSPGRADPGFLRWIVLSRLFLDPVSSSVQGAKMPRASWDFIKTLSIPLPPLEEQRAIADYLDRETAQIDELIAEQRRFVALLLEREAAIVAQYVSVGGPVPLRRVIAELRQGWSPNCEPWPADGVTEWGVLKVGCSNSGRFDPAENKRLPSGETPRPDLAVRRGEIVMSRSNTKELVGAASVVGAEYPKLLLSDLTYGLTTGPAVMPEFLSYALRTPEVRAQIGAASKGTSPSMQKISQRDVGGLMVRVPSLERQRAAVLRLDAETAKIDALIAETERFIELARERRSALITAAVTGQIDVHAVPPGRKSTA